MYLYRDRYERPLNSLNHSFIVVALILDVTGDHSIHGYAEELF